MANNWQLGMIAGLDGTQSRNQLNSDIKGLARNLDKLKLYTEIDKNQVIQLQNQLKKLQIDLNTVTVTDAAINGLVQKINDGLKNIQISNINVGNVGNQAQQVGQQIGNNIAQGVQSGVAKATTAMKSFSQLTDSMKSQDILFNNEGLQDTKLTLDAIKRTYSEFGQVKITNQTFNLDELQSFKVNIEQVNGELKETRSFMMSLSSDKTSFVLPDDVIKGTEKYVQHLNTAKNVINATGEEANALKQKLAEQEKYYGNIKKEVNTLYSLKAKLLSADQLETSELERQIKSTKQRITYNNQQIDKKGLRDNSLTREVNDLEVAKQKQLALAEARLQDSTNAKSQAQSQKELNAALKEQQSLSAQANKIQLSTDITKIENDYKKFGIVSQEVENNLKELKIAQDAVVNAKGTDRLATEIEKYNQKLAETKSSWKELQATQVSLSQRTSQMTTMQEWMRKNKNAIKLVGNEVNKLIEECKTCDAVRFNGIKNEFKELQVQAGKAGKLGNSFFGGLIEQGKKFAQWVGVSGLVTKLGMAVKVTGRNVIELDDALTNISYTMDVTKSQLENIGNSSLETAIDLKTSASNVLDAVKTYANATETAESILNKAKPTIMMSNVSGMDTQQTVDILQGTMEQFDLAEDKLMHISDVMQTVSANMPYDFAKGLRELSEGIQASGSVAKDAGYDLENYTALLGTLIAKTRQSGSELGRSLRTMFVRTTKASSSALANGEVTEEDLSNAEKALRRVGIEVRSDIDTFKSFDEIMGELYNKVDSLSEVDLSNIAYEVASTRQTNVFKMMVKAYGEYQDMAEKAYNADGATLANQNKYAESLKGKLGELGAIWEKIGDDTVSSSFLKGLTDVGIGVSSLVENFGLLKTAIVGIGAYAGFKNLDHQKVLKKLHRFLSWSNIDKEMIKWFIVQVYVFGSFKINQRGVIAGTDAYEYSTKAELVTINVNVRKAEKTEYSAYGKLCANIMYA